MAFFEEKVGFAMRAPRRFGGFGNVFAERTARKGRLLYVGEAAGFQDALFGFGMRYAMVSGALAARAWSNGRPETYDGLLRQRFGRLFKAGMVNRDLYGRLGDGGYARLMRRGASHSDIRDWLHRYYHGGLWTPLYYPLARRRLATRRRLIAGCREGCSCTWCRCEGHRSSPVAGERDRGSHRATATGT